MRCTLIGMHVRTLASGARATRITRESEDGKMVDRRGQTGGQELQLGCILAARPPMAIADSCRQARWELSREHSAQTILPRWPCGA
jgi:hypothetical protein